jgi:hypothetical protein
LASRTKTGHQGGYVNLKQVLGWLALAFVIWWVVVDPTSAAHLVHNIGVFLSDIAHGLSTFFTSL